jgi:predicted DNA binding protein
VTSIAEYTLFGGDFPLGRVFEERPRVTLELDRMVPSGDTVMPYFWVYDPECGLDAVLATFETLPELRAVTLMEDLGDRGLFRAEWKPEYMGIMRAIEEAGVTVVSATGSNDGWTFELRADAPERLSAFQAHCEEHDIDVSLARLRQLSETGRGDAYGVTDEQSEALLLAYERGYYRTPKAVSLAELADEVDITGQPFGSRLRRGTHRLIENTLASDTEST